MKLREQIKLCVDNDQLEKVADNHAIEFAEWCDNKASQISHGEWTNFLPNAKNCLTSKELLEIYKKEKQL